MPFLMMFIIWLMFVGKNNIRVYRKLENKIGPIFFGLILFSMISSLIPGLIGAMVALIILLAPFGFLFYIFSKIFGRKNKNKNQNQNAEKNKTSRTGLTKSVPKRRKIIEKFNKKYQLNLTDAEIARIVDASYMSYAWEREVNDMQKDYNSVYEWYNTDTCWLRAYLRAFSVQSVSSDFELQRKICLDSFIQIFNDIDTGSFATIDDCVEEINNRYFTSFDESTFMLAYRFLEMKGMKYDLPNHSVLKNESELERLKHKYDDEAKADTSRTVKRME